MMRIIQIVPTLEQEASGPSYSVPRLANGMAERGHYSSLMTVGDQAVSVGEGVHLTRYPHNFRALPVVRNLFLSRELDGALRRAAGEVDIIHSHGLWAMPNVYSGWAAKLSETPLIVSPRGTLGAAPLSYSRRRKEIFWRLLQGPAVRQATCLHATCEAEYLEIRHFGLKQPVIVVPNGVDAPPLTPVQPDRGRSRRLLYLSRLHRKKGVEMLLKAWVGLSGRHRDWELRIVGPGETDYVDELKRLSLELRLSRVTFLGPRYGSEKFVEYADADLFVLPSFNENFGIAVAEALAMETPVVTTTGTPWSDIESNRCGWWVNPNVTALTGALDDALSRSPAELSAMGKRGRSWMERDFSWAGIAASMEQAYTWVLTGGTVPASVRVD